MVEESHLDACQSNLSGVPQGSVLALLLSCILHDGLMLNFPQVAN